MSMEIWTDSGLVYEAKHMVKLLQAKDVPECNKICKKYTSKLDAAGKKNFAAVISCCTDTKKQSTLPKWKKALSSFDAVVKKNKWLDEYESEGRYNYCEQVSELWSRILKKIRPTMRGFDRVMFFEDWRQHGMGVPIGKVCFIFNTDDMFKTTLTAEGKAFEKHMGEVEETLWTYVDY